VDRADQSSWWTADTGPLERSEGEARWRLRGLLVQVRIRWEGLGGTYSAVDERKKSGETSLGVVGTVALATAAAMTTAEKVGSNMFAKLDSIVTVV